MMDRSRGGPVARAVPESEIVGRSVSLRSAGWRRVTWTGELETPERSVVLTVSSIDPGMAKNCCCARWIKCLKEFDASMLLLAGRNS